MPESTQRRVDSNLIHNLFWIIDLQGRYGFCLQSKDLFSDFEPPANLKGIDILKRNSAYDYGELFLVLHDKEDWQIFHSLCEDLISITHNYDNDKAMVAAVETRLKRWQELLKQNIDCSMSLSQQMGLFSELVCLRDIVISKYGIKQSIKSWVGPDFDKQDFLLDKEIIEVKSYKTSKGQTVHISSIKQLISDKTPLFLLTYGMTETENGHSIADVVKDINIQLKLESNEVKNIFENKLLRYGYMPEAIKTPLHKFIVDKSRVFLTSDGFPKIQQSSIKHGIMDVKYSIDLLECADFEKDVSNFLG